ncbi:MAG: glycosyltransferase family 39 protein [Acetatifactor sp.]|nr:glycosyltransferase family 39 protein [Acetatifactor sp.]
MSKRRLYIWAGLLLLAASLLRICHIAAIPLGMHIDEAGLGLNAWSIAGFGTDRYGNFLPVCPSNFYGEQSAFYTYFCALLVKLFGLSIVTLRMPAALMGIITVLFGALLMREKWGDKGLLAGLALLGIFPYFIMNSRFALDCNSMLGALTVSLYVLVRLLKKAHRCPGQRLYGYFALAGILLGVTLYTYIIAALVVSVFCVLWGLYYLFYRREGRFLRFRQLLFLAVPLWLLAIPLILVFAVNYFDLDPIATPFFSVPKMITNRTEEVTFSLSAMLGKLRNLTYPFTSDGKYGSSDRYWTMYLFSPPLIAAGLIHSVLRSVKDLREKCLSPDLILLFLTLAEGFMFLLCGYYNYHINGVFIALAFFCVNGIFAVGGLLRKHPARLAWAAVLTVCYGASFAGFAGEYFFPKDTAVFQIYGGVDQALSLLTPEQRSREIYVLDEVGEFYFLSNPVPPDEFASHCSESGFLQDYQNLHFRAPEKYTGEEILVCNKGSGWHGIFSDKDLTGYSYSVLETAHYYVFYRK